jgi:Kdo2-lipid IVA lauroyltransferase/acyltransferase
VNFILYLLFLFYAYLFALTPFRVLYLFSDLLYYPFYYVIRYRKKVVFDNLSTSFPEKTEKEITAIAKAFYHHFCDILVEGIKAFSMSAEESTKRMKIMNPELFLPFYEKKQPVIIVQAHYNNWEWGPMAAAIQMRHQPVGLYKPLTNKYVDGYIKRTRSKGGTILVSIEKTRKMFETYLNGPTAFVMIADQSPFHTEHALWVNFLNHDTPTLHGPEKYAVRYVIPVIYVAVEKVRRGYYEATFSILAENPSQTARGEITARFMKALENQILEKPEFWLWSHRRWKRKREVPVQAE